jgi:threonine dehydrogenase-like Zn-dependent dehydrogenase
MSQPKEAAMRAVAVTSPGRVELVDIPRPEPGPYEALIRTEVVCLCNATDRKLIDGHFPGVEEYPLLLGHETCGIVEAVGDKVRTFHVGDRVIGGLLLRSTSPDFASGWGGFSDYILAGDHQAMVDDGVADDAHGYAEVFEIMRPVAPDIPAEAAVLLCTWREVYAAFGDFNLTAGDRVLIYGAGPVGLSFVKFGRLLGLAWIGVVDPLPDKREVALRMGADAVFAPGEEADGAIAKRLGRPLDAVVDAVGREGIINAALPLIKMAGSVCVYGVIDKPTVLLEKARGPYNFNLLVHQWPARFREAAAQEPLCDWLRAGLLKPEEFLSAEYGIEQIGEAIALTATGQSLKTMLRF